MANPLPNEREIYARIKGEKITIEHGMLDFIYHYIGDDITAITLLCQYYLTNNEPIPPEQAERVLIYTRDIEMIINNITMATQDNFPFPQFKNNIPLDQTIKDLLMYHFGNDVYVINLIVYDSLHALPGVRREINESNTEKIIKQTEKMKMFLDKLRLATSENA